MGPQSRITEATTDTQAAHFTAVGDGAACDPGAPDQYPWSDDYAYAIDYRAPTSVAFWSGEGGPRVRPTRINVTLCCSLRHIRWRTFGGRTAVGFGRFRSPVPKGARCLECGKRFKVVLTRPSRCTDALGQRVYYGKVAFVTTRQIGVLKPGTEEISFKPTCYGGAQPIR